MAATNSTDGCCRSEVFRPPPEPTEDDMKAMARGARRVLSYLGGGFHTFFCSLLWESDPFATFFTTGLKPPLRSFCAPCWGYAWKHHVFQCVDIICMMCE